MGWSDNTGGGVELRHYRFFRFFIGYPVYAVALFSFFRRREGPFFRFDRRSSAAVFSIGFPSSRSADIERPSVKVAVLCMVPSRSGPGRGRCEGGYRYRLRERNRCSGAGLCFPVGVRGGTRVANFEVILQVRAAEEKRLRGVFANGSGRPMPGAEPGLERTGAGTGTGRRPDPVVRAQREIGCAIADADS